MIVTQAGLGLRVAELLALRVEDVNFLGRTVKIDWQLTQNGLDRVDPKLTALVAVGSDSR